MKALNAVVYSAVLLFFANEAIACSDFQIKAKDGSVVIGRTMEFPVNLRSKIWSVPRSSQNKYAYLGIDAVGKSDLICDGMNEKGLSVEGLMFTDAKYQEPVQGKRSIPITELASYILGSFSSVEEVKKEFSNIRVTLKPILELGGALGFHLAVHDANKNNLVVEFVDGDVKLYDNPLGVMTNRPEFDWHLTNLSNYMNLDPNDKKVLMMNGLKVNSLSVGNGLLGLPGDWTSPSRFIRLAWAVSSALPVKNSDEAVNLASHIINSIDMPLGAIKEPFHLYGYAQWVVVKDLTNKVLYYRSYNNQTMKSIDMKKLDLNAGATPKKVSIEEGAPKSFDVSGMML